MEYLIMISITTNVSGNRVTIIAIVAANDQPITGCGVNFYFNGKLAGTALTNSQNIAIFT